MNGVSLVLFLTLLGPGIQDRKYIGAGGAIERRSILIDPAEGVRTILQLHIRKGWGAATNL